MTRSANPFRYFNSSPEVIRLVVMMYVRFPLSLRNVEDLLFERGIDICHETVRLWWNRFGPLFAADIRRQRVSRMRGLDVYSLGVCQSRWPNPLVTGQAPAFERERS
jgi:putative transposase